MVAVRPLLPICILALFSAACEKCAPGQVGDGVARLTVRNVGAIADLINNDTACGFSSPAVKPLFTTNGMTGAMGSVTWTVQGCILNPSGSSKVSSDCNRTEQTISGKAKVSAKRTIVGTLTGNPDQPVIPMSPDAVTVELTNVEFEDFMVTESNSDARLMQMTGSLSAKVQPKLAASQTTGVCSIPTRNVRLSAISYKNASVHVHNSSHDFDVDVADSSIDAYNGKYSGKENAIQGTISVYGNKVTLPSDGSGLDPNYDNAKLESSYACTPDLRVPVVYECGDIQPQLAEGAARLTIRNFGMLVTLLDLDTTCGFSSPAVMQGAQQNGAVGSMGDITYTVTACTLSFADNSVADTDCAGKQTNVSGKVTVTGTKQVHGKLTGDPMQPVVPVSDTPANVQLTNVQFDNFKIMKDGSSLNQISGGISGQLTPRVARDAMLGACAFKTPIARFDGITYAPNTKVELGAAQGTFQTVLGGSMLHAVNGTWDNDSNVLQGSIMLGTKSFDLPTNPMDAGLDPMFNQSAFDSSWMCGNLDRSAPFDCGFEKPIAQGASQLTVLTLGTLADLIESDTNCGFSSQGVVQGAQTTGTLGDPGGSATFTIAQPCMLTFMMKTPAKSDCNMKSTFVEGVAMVSGTKTLAGYISGDPNQPIVPTSRDPATLNLTATFQNFKISTSDTNNSLMIKSGQLTGSVAPRTAIDSTTGACSIPTPVALISNVQYQNAVLEVSSMGKTFDINVSASNLNAVNGSRDGMTNSLTGTINVDGTMFEIPISPNMGLDPSYNQGTFDSSYVCTPNMRLPQGDQDCNMQGVLAGGAARLLIQALGSVTSVANSDNNCGFSAHLTNPSAVIGNDGQEGALEWTIQNCDLPHANRNAQGVAQSTDCLQRQSFTTGKATVSGMRHVDGLRQDIHLLFLTFHSITPDTPEAVKVNLDNINFTEMASYNVDPGQMHPTQGITIHSGSMSAHVEPIVGEEQNTTGKFDIPTPVARMQNVAVTNAAVTILYQGKSFNVHVDSAMLNAFNGSYARTGEKNLINGTISIGGQAYALNSEPLDPAFDQGQFDMRYACTNNLRATIPPAP